MFNWELSCSILNHPGWKSQKLSIKSFLPQTKAWKGHNLQTTLKKVTNNTLKDKALCYFLSYRGPKVCSFCLFDFFFLMNTQFANYLFCTWKYDSFSHSPVHLMKFVTCFHALHIHASVCVTKNPNSIPMNNSYARKTPPSLRKSSTTAYSKHCCTIL